MPIRIQLDSIVILYLYIYQVLINIVYFFAT